VSIHGLSTGFLENHAKQGHGWAIRELALLHLKGKGIKQDLSKGRTLLHWAALSADRKASWLLAIYYHTGQYNFPVNVEKSHIWRERTEKRLKSDASLIYDNPDYEKLAAKRYSRWCQVREWLISACQ